MPEDVMEQTFRLCEPFQHVEVTVKSGFAQDAGNVTEVKQVTIDGQPWEDLREVLSGIVAHWKGWSASGGSEDDDVLATARAFTLAWFPIAGGELLNDEQAPEDLLEAVAGVEVPAYHPLKVGLYDLDDDSRIVVATHFERGEVGMRGRQWTYQAHAFHVADGRSFPLVPAQFKAGQTGPQPTDPAIPRPVHWDHIGD